MSGVKNLAFTVEATDPAVPGTDTKVINSPDADTKISDAPDADTKISDTLEVADADVEQIDYDDALIRFSGKYQMVIFSKYMHMYDILPIDISCF